MEEEEGKKSKEDKRKKEKQDRERQHTEDEEEKDDDIKEESDQKREVSIITARIITVSPILFVLNYCNLSNFFVLIFILVYRRTKTRTMAMTRKETRMRKRITIEPQVPKNYRVDGTVESLLN